MFDNNFKAQTIRVNHIDLFVVTGGEGPPLLLLHGFPQTHVIWHKLAPALARQFSLVMPDLRGYGNSATPPSDACHQPYSKREMAKDIIALADHLGHHRFALAGHDRGARVGYRLVLDNPGRVSKFCAIDIIPTLDVWQEMDANRALAQFHWTFLAAPSPLPETLIGNNPGYFYEALLRRWSSDINLLDKRAIRSYLHQYVDPRRIHAQCEDYRAGAGCDRQIDQADRDAGKKLDCPVLLLWGKGYLGEKAGSPADSWKKWADQVQEVALDCGHFVVEEAPEQSLEALLGFFA